MATNTSKAQGAQPADKPDDASTPAAPAPDDAAAPPAQDPAPLPDPPPATVATARYAEPSEGMRLGQYAPEARHGIVQPDGTVKPTARRGKDEPKPGEYGTIVVQKGDVVTAAVRATLGITD